MLCNKEGIVPLISLSLLVVVCICAVVVFQGWLFSYNTGILVDDEQEVNKFLDGGMVIDTIVGSDLLLINNVGDNLNVTAVKVGGYDCNISTNLSLGLQELSLTSCLGDVSIGKIEVVVYTDKGIRSKYVYLKNQYVPVPNCVTVDDSDLVGLWHFDDDLSDVSGNSNNGTAQNGANFSSVDAKFGSAASFDGVNDYVSVADDSSLEFGSSDFTISMWVKSDKIHLGTLVSKGSGVEDSNTEYSLSVSSRMFINSVYQDEVIPPSEVGQITVHGEVFTGDVITVGNDGKYSYNYTNIQTAFSSATDGAMILVYPGTYTITGELYPSVGNSLYVRGMGKSANDVLIYRSNSYHAFRISLSNFNYTVENMKIQTAYSWGGAFVHRECNADTVTYLNKLNLIATNSGYVVYFGDSIANSDYKGDSYITNINIDRGYATLREVGAGSTTSTISVSRAWYADSYSCSTCLRNPSPHGYVTSATVGYGHAYGDYLLNFFQITPNAWTHVAVVYDTSYTPDKLFYYINGVEVNNLNVSGSYTANLDGDFYFGSRGPTYNRFSGFMDDVAIFKRVLTPSEISSIAESSNPICD